MGFFDELSDMANNVKKGTQDALDISKYNSNIKAEERRINEIKTMIGEKYYELFKDNPAEELKSYIDDINACLVTIEENNKKIKQINESKKAPTTSATNGGVVCKNCGASNSADAAFCVNCGKPIEKEVVKPAVVIDGVTCKNCGTVNEKGYAFCVGCGQPLKAEEATEEVKEEATEEVKEEVVEEVKEEAKPAKAKSTKKAVKVDEPAKKICSNCGAENDPSMNFCTECGTKLGE